jgi:hypothetical protein
MKTWIIREEYISVEEYEIEAETLEKADAILARGDAEGTEVDFYANKRLSAKEKS